MKTFFLFVSTLTGILANAQSGEMRATFFGGYARHFGPDILVHEHSHEENHTGDGLQNGFITGGRFGYSFFNGYVRANAGLEYISYTSSVVADSQNTKDGIMYLVLNNDMSTISVRPSLDFVLPGNFLVPYIGVGVPFNFITKHFDKRLKGGGGIEMNSKSDSTRKYFRTGFSLHAGASWRMNTTISLGVEGVYDIVNAGGKGSGGNIVTENGEEPTITQM